MAPASVPIPKVVPTIPNSSGDACRFSVRKKNDSALKAPAPSITMTAAISMVLSTELPAKNCIPAANSRRKLLECSGAPSPDGGRGRTKEIATSDTTKEKQLSISDHRNPRLKKTGAASAGLMTSARLDKSWLRLAACGKCRSSTMSAMIATRAGEKNCAPTPASNTTV